jgi:primosomal protein N'
MFRVRGRHRRRVLVKTGRRADAVASVGAVVEALASERGLKDVALGVDVDPQ